MASLVFILATFALLAAFISLTDYETKRGTRLFAAGRARLDENVERVEFILAHIDIGAFLRNETRLLASRVGHEVVHFSLVVVRAVEKTLTRVIRHQHANKETATAPVESAREYVKTLSDFKEQLEATRPQMPDIQKM